MSRAQAGAPATTFGRVIDHDPVGSAIEGAQVVSGAARRVIRADVAFAACVGCEREAAIPAELDAVRKLLNRALGDGVLELSAGMFYPPAVYTETDEFFGPGEVETMHDAVLAIHMPDRGDLLMGPREEERIALHLECRVPPVHLPAASRRPWGRVVGELEVADCANKVDDFRSAIDVDPYVAGSTDFAQLLPTSAFKDNTSILLERVVAPAARAQTVRALDEGPASERRRTGVTGTGHDPLVGQTLTDLATTGAHYPNSLAAFGRGEGTLAATLQHPGCVSGSDGLGSIWPVRTNGSYTRLLPAYVGDGPTVMLKDIARRATSAVVERIVILDRDVIALGTRTDPGLLRPPGLVGEATCGGPQQSTGDIGLITVAGQVVQQGHVPGRRPSDREPTFVARHRILKTAQQPERKLD